MKRRHRYLALAILGILLPYWQFVPWLFEHGLDLSLFFRELFANRIGAFFAMDVLVSAIVLIIFVQVEGRRLGIRGLGWHVASRRLFRTSAVSVFATNPAQSKQRLTEI